MSILIAEHGAEMEAMVREQVKMITEAMAEAARYGKCPADLRGSLIGLAEWLRTDKRDFMKWSQVTGYAHSEYLKWYSWITRANTRPRPELEGMSADEYYELFITAGSMTKDDWYAIFPELDQERQELRDKYQLTKGMK